MLPPKTGGATGSKLCVDVNALGLAVISNPRARILFSAALCLALQAPAHSGVEPDSDLPARLQEASKRWAARHVASYTYTIEEQCLSCSPIVRVRVHKGECLSAQGAPADNGSSPCSGRTVPELLAMIRAWVKVEGGATITATFDEKFGYPTSWEIKTSSQTDATVARVLRFRTGS